ncbi:MAG TPA: hypothetical protein VGB74_12260 [Actinoplanes sp.]
MPEEFFLSASHAAPPLSAPPYSGPPYPPSSGPPASAAVPLTAAAGTLAGTVAVEGERVLWSGRCAVAEYAFEEPESLPRWTLPEQTEVVITEQRVVYRDQDTMDTGELQWPWPQHLRVQPGNRETGRAATVTQIQLVCAGPAETFPALVFAGGDLSTVDDADRFANLLRQTIARYRVENATDLGLTAPQARMLSRLLIGPEFRNYQGGDGQTVSLLGALPVQDEVPGADPSSATAYRAASYAEPLSSTTYPATGYAEAVSPHASASAPPAVAAPTSYPPPGPADAPYGGAAPYAPASYPPPAPYVVPAPYVLPALYAGPGPYPGSVSPASAGHGTPAPGSPAAGTLAPGSPAAASPAPLAHPRPASTHPRPAADNGRHSGFGSAPGRPLPAPVDLDSRAADVAARVAELVAGGADPDRPSAPSESPITKLSTILNPPGDNPPVEQPATGEPRSGLSRAEAVRITAARMVGNTTRQRGTPPPRTADGEIGATTRNSPRS